MIDTTNGVRTTPITIDATGTTVSILGPEYGQRVTVEFGDDLDRVIDRLLALRYENDQQLDAVPDLAELAECDYEGMV